MKKMTLLLGVFVLIGGVVLGAWATTAQVDRGSRLFSDRVLEWQRPVTEAGLPLKLSARLNMPQPSTWQVAQAQLTEWGVPASWLEGNGSWALTGLLLAVVL
ncbi:MAG: hypothetical protein HQM04_13320 [Magnetococcales bacterium]|nr:hypothetical protein [Magnetococcales bacterium]MBF0116005.1 hypothetical protein [Magnetococcales bacterium]